MLHVRTFISRPFIAKTKHFDPDLDVVWTTKSMLNPFNENTLKLV